ncbi:g4430 [Coccomyxa elongata]
MVASILAREKEAQTAMATALPCVIIDGGILIFEQFRFQSQLQLQAFQVMAFLFMEAGALSFNNKDIWMCLRDVLILMPIIVVGQLGTAAWLELRSREAFLRKHQQPLSHLGTFWQCLHHKKEQLKAQLCHAKDRQL